jgi:hypothetical protein
VAQVPNAPGIVSLQVTGSRFPRVVTAEIPPPFEVLSVDRVSNTLVIVNALYNGGAEVGDKFSLTIRGRSVSATWQRVIEIVEVPITIRIQQPTALDGVVVQGDAINFAPVLLSGDTGGTWTSTSLPSGASLNSSTGNITGTLSTLGRTFIYLTYTLGGESDTVLFVIHVVDQIQTLAGQTISTPINLATANRVYRLLGDVTADRTAITMSGNNILLDLNGFTINYDNEEEIPNFPNPEFAGGSTSGWDLSGATGAAAVQGTLAAKTAYNDGEYALTMAVTAGSPKTITTSDSFDFVAGEWYSIDLWNTELAVGADITITFAVGSNDSTVLTAAEYVYQGGRFRPGAFTSYIFQANATETVPVSITITCSSGTKTVYLSKLSLRRAYCHGIVSGAGPSSWYPNGNGAGNIGSTVCNGTLNQVNRTPHSHSYSGTWYLYLDSVTASNKCRVTSGYGFIVSSARSYGMYVTNCELSSEPLGINSRDNAHGWLLSTTSAGTFGGGYVFRDNVITKTIQGGFLPTTLAGHDRRSLLGYNTIDMQQRYTNGFGMSASGLSGLIAECKNNVMDLTSSETAGGRGIRVGNYATMRNNYLKVRSLPLNMEYTNGFTLGGAYAMQLEDTGIDCNFYNETYICDGPGGGAAFRINGPIQSPIAVYDCVFEIDSSVVSPPQSASCLKISDPGSPSLDLSQFDVQRCTLKTNQILIESIGVNIINTMTLTDCLIHIVQDSNYGNNLFSISDGWYVFVNPTYFNSTSQTLFEAAVAANARVSIV